MMNEIEKQVQLPKGARNIDNYARYYAAGPEGQVIGIYLLPVGGSAVTGECEELMEDMTSRPVPCPQLRFPTDDIKAGERRWLEDQQKLPLVNDGGCDVVNVLFNPTTRQIEQAICNGVA